MPALSSILEFVYSRYNLLVAILARLGFAPTFVLQVEGANNSAEHVRRRQQMQGKYHTPLVGDNHQVSHLPPLPPPSRPWAGILPGAAAAAAAAAPAAEAKSPSLSPSLGGSAVVDAAARATCSKPAAQLPAKLPVELENEQTVEAAAAATVSPRPAAAGNATTACPSTAAPGLQHAVCDSEGNCPAAAHDAARCAPSYPLPCAGTPKIEFAPCIGGRPEAERAGVAVTTESTAAAATGSRHSSPTVVSKPPAAVCALASTQEDCAREVDLAIEGPVVSGGTETTQMLGGPAGKMPGGETSPVGQSADAIEVENVNSHAEVAVAITTSAVPVATPNSVVNQSFEEGGNVAVSTSGSSHGPLQGGSVSCLGPVAAAVAAVTEKLSAVVCMAADKPASSGSQILVAADGGEHKGKLSAEIYTSVSPTVQQSKTAGSKGNGRSSRTSGYSVEGWEGAGSTPALSPAIREPPERSSLLKGVPVAVLATSAGRGSSFFPLMPAGATAAAPKGEAVVVLPAGALNSASEPPPCATISTKMPAALTHLTSPVAAGRKRKLPMGVLRSGVGGSGGEGGEIGNCGDGRSSFRRGGETSGAATLPPPPPPPSPPPLPELSFEDVAELVWDPRSGPKPRGVAEARGRAGTAASKSALERAMWDRDSTLLERVAPAHAEKSMQVLQTCRHDVERAAQMLTVRHGIHVVGLSSVRTTRNKRAEQQALSAAVSRPCSSLAGTCSGGGGGSGGSVGSASGGNGSNGTSFEGWQSAAVPTTVAAVPVRAAAAATVASPRGCKQTDAQGVTREGAKLAGDAFMRHGRDLNAVQKALGWPKKEVVEYYYCVWKYSPAYQVMFVFV